MVKVAALVSVTIVFVSSAVITYLGAPGEVIMAATTVSIITLLLTFID